LFLEYDDWIVVYDLDLCMFKPTSPLRARITGGTGRFEGVRGHLDQDYRGVVPG